MFYNILDEKRINILPLFEGFKKDFYLGGGTALAIQIGHRDSVDFDFFSERDINTKELFEHLREIFKEHILLKIQEEYNTLTVLVDATIKISFFGYKYKLIKETINNENLFLASIEDIGCMKLSAITGRASNKDYIDLHFILKRVSLSDLLEDAHIKYPELERNLILKSLVYFADAEYEDEPEMIKEASWEELKVLITKKVRELTP